MIKRVFDICLSIVGIVLLSPLFVIIALIIRKDSSGPVIYRQQRIGQNGVSFNLLKFRTMANNSEKLGYLTIGYRDPRITPVGYFLRKYKLDELPQLFNVLSGKMSFVGPRPEVIKYVKLYTPWQLKVLSVRPGITDYASIRYYNENELLAQTSDPESLYINQIIPIKIKYNLIYVDDHTLWTDIKIILKTIKKIFFNKI